MNDSIEAAARSAASQHGWSESHARQAIVEYERFVQLAERHPAAGLVPPADVDQVWHHHLCSGDYATAFPGGAPLHTDHTTHDHAERFELTRSLYQQTFGNPGHLWNVAAECHAEEPFPYGPDPEPPGG